MICWQRKYNYMRKKFVLILFLFLVFVIAIGSGCKTKNHEAGKIKVAATIFPISDIIKNVAGDKIEVINILPAGASPHTFEVTPKQIKELADVKVIFMIDHGLDDWVKKVKDSVPNATLVNVDQNINLLRMGNEEESITGKDPHYWLNAANAKIIAENINNSLAEIDSKNSEYYNNNFNNYLFELDKLDLDIKEELKDLQTRNIVTFHEAWGYFAKAYDLKVEATIEPFPGKEPTIQYLEDLNKIVKDNNVKVIFSEPQLSNETIKPFVNDLGLKLYVLDPIGGVEGRNSYVEMMKYNAQTFKEALNQ